jgi:hypothetical protein
MADTDLQLTFDPKIFTVAINQIVEKLSGLETQLLSVATNTTKMEKHGASAIGMWTAVATTGIGLIATGIKKMLSFLPEVGHSFSIMGDIIGRNLLWPLRQELIPLLQGMLNWVRDHRALFIRWGMVIANVFRVLVAIIKHAFEFWSKMFEKLSAGLKKIFGGTIKTVTDLMNLLLFKYAVVIVGLQTLLEPVFSFLVDTFITLVKYSKAFFDGFSRGFGSFGGAINVIVNDIAQLFAMFAGAQNEIAPVTEAFALLGKTLGGLASIVFTPLLIMFQSLIGGLKMMVVLIRFIKNMLDPKKTVSWIDLGKNLKQAFGETGKGIEDTGATFIETQKKIFMTEEKENLQSKKADIKEKENLQQRKALPEKEEIKRVVPGVLPKGNTGNTTIINNNDNRTFDLKVHEQKIIPELKRIINDRAKYGPMNPSIAPSYTGGQ